MKTLGKLQIKSEKILKNEELVNLKGGYDGLHYVNCGNGCGGTVWSCDPGYIRLICSSCSNTGAYVCV